MQLRDEWEGAGFQNKGKVRFRSPVSLFITQTSFKRKSYGWSNKKDKGNEKKLEGGKKILKEM